MTSKWLWDGASFQKMVGENQQLCHQRRPDLERRADSYFRYKPTKKFSFKVISWSARLSRKVTLLCRSCKGRTNGQKAQVLYYRLLCKKQNVMMFMRVGELRLAPSIFSFSFYFLINNAHAVNSPRTDNIKKKFMLVD